MSSASQSRFWILPFAACVLFVPIDLLSGGERNDGKPRPNIVLMMADDLGWGDVAYNGNRIVKTPHLDAMAGEGLRLNRFYAAAPVCSPTRGSCVTGRHPFRYGVFSANVGHMRPPEITLAELLAAHGYATGHFGKWHLGTLTKTMQESNRGGTRGAKHFSPPWENGFDECFSTEAKVPTWDPMLRPQGVKRTTWWNPVADESTSEAYGTHYWSNGTLVRDNLRGDDSRVIMDRAIPFIRKAAAAKQPFFAIVWFHAPHLPVVAGPKYAKMYARHGDYAKHYFGCITALDEQVGRLRQELRTLGVADNTLVTFCADNGPEGKAGSAPGSAGKLRGRKRDLFEGGVRVPGILEWPARLASARSSDVPTSTSDYLPTILDALGIAMPDARPLDGISLLPLVDGKLTERPRPIAFESAGRLALVDNRYKIVYYPAGKKQRRKAAKADVDPAAFMLFDLINDPAEKHDLAAEHPQIIMPMAKTLLAWRRSCRESLAGKDYRNRSRP